MYLFFAVESKTAGSMILGASFFRTTFSDALLNQESDEYKALKTKVETGIKASPACGNCEVQDITFSQVGSTQNTKGHS